MDNISAVPKNESESGIRTYTSNESLKHAEGTKITEEIQEQVIANPEEVDEDQGPPDSELHKFLVALVCGVALISDGYCANTIGSVITILRKLYPKETEHSHALQKVGMISFVGVIVGQLSFGFVSDRIGRKYGMLIATVILIVSTALCAGAYGPHGSISGMITVLMVFRFFLGVGIGAESPCGSVAASESSAEMKSGHRHAVFIAVTNTAIDVGFVLGALVPFILCLIFGDQHLRVVWRLSIGLGVIVPIILLYYRLRLKDSHSYTKNRLQFTKVPWFFVIRRYGPRLLVVSLIWFVYDMSAYAFALYSSTIIARVLPSNATMAQTFGWSTLISSFNLPGTIFGAFGSDFLGPKYCLITGLVLQSVVGFLLSGFFPSLVKHLAGFCVLYGLFLTLGEFGPGNNVGVLASKTCPAAFRGLYYGIAAAIGKCGAAAGVYAFGGNAVRTYFFIASGMSLGVAILALFLVPKVQQSCIQDEDAKFAQLVKDRGYDVFEFSKPVQLSDTKQN
ncbi:glycerophosphodiester transporter [Schizosaccharomyces japonicus yFS275]|uniref:Glycerophosphodiester transporter n=1 Tax=Schizosaccharomyces japonicus (strain yFS275 / FY16936) TaxID=402676 RepID=B6JV31_SCHJY|nr:glycerophosphodiester transporter [Schizosaccharomyces japonicus yFS275]EEB05232.1 glycerophosphodiester transporter [Schizosaccharomyces japonicus yFS275]